MSTKLRTAAVVAVSMAMVVAGGSVAHASTLYEHTNYSGATWSSAKPAPGSAEQAPNVGSMDNRASSVLTSGARFFDGLGYTGASIMLTTSYNALGSIGWNDRISSFHG